jgi:hypothetical protein
MSLAHLRITPWGGVGLEWAAAGLRRERRGERRWAVSPWKRGESFLSFQKSVFIFYSNSFAF